MATKKKKVVKKASGRRYGRRAVPKKDIDPEGATRIPNRGHNLVSKLSKPYQKAINKALVDGKTYAQVLDMIDGWVAAGKIKAKEAPRYSTIASYARKFLIKLEEVERVREQAKELVKRAGGNGLVLEQASADLILTMLMDILVNKKVTKKDIATLSLSLGRLQASSASRERAKVYVLKHIKKRAARAAANVSKVVKSQGLSQGVVSKIKKEILGIVDGSK